MTAYIYFLGSESFWDNYSKEDPNTKLYNVKEYCKASWDLWVDQDAYFIYGSMEVPVASAHGSDPDNIEIRAANTDDWLYGNWSSYNIVDAIVVLDYWGEDALGDMGVVVEIGSAAGASGGKFYTGLVDTYFEDNNEIEPPEAAEGSEGIALHELSHLWNCKHTDARTYSSEEASVLYIENATPECYDGYNVEDRNDWISYCSQLKIYDHYTQHV